SSNVRLREWRSAIAPPKGPSTALGANPAAATSPAQNDWSVASVTKMPTPTVSIQVPMFDTNAPDQKSANCRCRSGAKEAVTFIVGRDRADGDRSGRAPRLAVRRTFVPDGGVDPSDL